MRFLIKNCKQVLLYAKADCDRKAWTSVKFTSKFDVRSVAYVIVRHVSGLLSREKPSGWFPFAYFDYIWSAKLPNGLEEIGCLPAWSGGSSSLAGF